MKTIDIVRNKQDTTSMRIQSKIDKKNNMKNTHTFLTPQKRKTHKIFFEIRTLKFFSFSIDSIMIF